MRGDNIFYILWVNIYYILWVDLGAPFILGVGKNSCTIGFILFAVCFVCLFVVIKPDNPYFASLSGLEVKPLGAYPLGSRSSSFGSTKGTLPPRSILRANCG